MPYGRGGAGNIAQLQEGAKETEMIDMEAGKREHVDAEKEQREAATVSSTNDYAHMGRGGSGNWYSPRTLGATGEFTSDAHGSAAPASDPRAPSPLPTGTGSAPRAALTREPSEKVADPALHNSRWAGRGGAGNFVWETEQEELRKKQKAERERGIQESALRDVERALPKPGRAFLKAEGLDD